PDESSQGPVERGADGPARFRPSPRAAGPVITPSGLCRTPSRRMECTRGGRVPWFSPSAGVGWACPRRLPPLDRPGDGDHEGDGGGQPLVLKPGTHPGHDLVGTRPARDLTDFDVRLAQGIPGRDLLAGVLAARDVVPDPAAQVNLD